MAIIKCKMCGGDMELSADRTFGTCDFCGSTMTLPRIDDDQRAAAFNRGNHFRRIGEFDKALAVYERIVQESDTDAEAHWCCALCRFGIEYVEDPASYEYLPTCHRVSFDSFLEDVDYLAALAHSDGITRRQYQKDAARIAEVQRGILATSRNTQPYDVFLCYKESDEAGQRTRDSLLAQEIYYQLTEQGRRVFFARITLEEVAGTQYEPYIFAALNSARVMVVVGTRPEHLNAVWVKNEWSRFLAMMKKDRSKLLLPCYRDMDPYDMPEALAVLQSYDMGKIGFLQDLTRGIAKVLDAGKTPAPAKETVVEEPAGAAPTAPLLQRAFMFLEDGDWKAADEYCEKVLDREPENASAYLGKLMAELRVSSRAKLKDCEWPFDQKKNYLKATRFADDALAAELTGCITHIRERNERRHLESAYANGKEAMARAKTQRDYLDAACRFEEISEYADAGALARECREKAEIAGQEAIRAEKDAALAKGKEKMAEDTIAACESAAELFSSIPGWKDADELAAACRKRAEEIRTQEEARRLEEAQRARKRKKMAIWGSSAAVALIVFVILLVTLFIPAKKKSDFIAAYGQAVYDQYGLVEKGAEIFFGTYRNHRTMDADIAWIVLDVKDGKALLLSKYALDYRAFNEEKAYVTWETCTLRLWLNERFFQDAFSEEEMAMICSVTVSADKNNAYTTDPGNPTQDRVFLLSTEEMTLLRADEIRICEPTLYVESLSGYTLDDNVCDWWLRTPGRIQSMAAIVSKYDGGISENAVQFKNGVRPAIWIDLRKG